MPTVELRGIRNFGCQGTNLEIQPNQLLVLLGPNGAGKTTILNVIAGLVQYEGGVYFDGAPVDGLPARDRKVGYVFQDLVLFPHMDVRSNIAFGLRGNGHTEHEVIARVSDLLDLLAISHLAARYPTRLSVGEKQRVAVARALAPHPSILLLDEPFNSLDSQTSLHLRAALKSLQRELGITTVFVTHDLAEAEEIADRIAIIENGVVERVGTPAEVLFSPPGPRARDYVGSSNVLGCVTSKRLGFGLAVADCGGLCLVVPQNGKEIRKVAISPRDVRVSVQRPSTDVNVFEGSIRATNRLPGSVMTHIDVDGADIVAELPHSAYESSRLSPGTPVFIELCLTKLRTSD